MSSVCLAVCDVGDLWSHRLEILETNCTDYYRNTFALCSQKAIHLLPGEHREILGRLRLEVGLSGVPENKIANIYETHKDEGKVTMEGL